MKGIRIGAALCAAVALAAGAASAHAAGPPAGPTLELTGTLSNYVAATKHQAGSITVTVNFATRPGYVSQVVTIPVTRQTKIVAHNKIKDGDVGTVKMQFGDLAPPHMTPTVPATMVVDQN